MNTNDENAPRKTKGRIPIGPHGLIEIPLDKKYVVMFRVVMLIAAIPFVREVYEIIVSGEAELRSFTATRGDHWGYYAELSKESMIALFLLWMGTFGVKAKDETPEIEH